MKIRRYSLLVFAAVALSACTPSVPQGLSISADPFGKSPIAHPQADGTQSVPHARPSDQRIFAAAPSLPSASGQLHVVVDEETGLPRMLVDDFSTLTGVKVNVVTVNQDQGEVVADLFVGFDDISLTGSIDAEILAQKALEGIEPSHPIAGRPAAVDYARDDVCLLADTQWFAANKILIPTDLKLLAEGTNPQLLALAPARSSTAAHFERQVTRALSQSADQWWIKVKAGALEPSSWEQAAQASSVRVLAQPQTREVPGRPQWAGEVPAPHPLNMSDTDRPQSGQPDSPQSLVPNDLHATASRPLRVAPVSVAARATTNTQTSGYMAPLSGSCSERYLYVIPARSVTNASAVEAFIIYLRSPRAQQILAHTGTAIPLDVAHATGTPVEWYVLNEETVK